MSEATVGGADPAVAPAFELPVPALGRWRDGNAGIEGVWEWDSGVPGRDLLVSALVHGNELCGAWALCDALDAGLRPRRGRLTLAFCNLAAFDRFDAAVPDASRFVDEDFNRIWGPSLDDRSMRSVERDRARQLRPLVERADWLLDLHSMHEPGEPLLLAGLAPRHRALARELGAPRCVIVDAGHAEGCRMRDHGRFGRIDGDDGSRSLLVECGWHGALSSRTVALDMLARFLAAAGTVDAADLPARWRQPSPPAQRVLEVTDAVVARGRDVQFARHWTSGENVPRAGTVLGWDGGRPFVTPYADCTLVMPSLRQLRPGVTVMRLARALPAG